MGQKWGALECGLSCWLRRLGRPNSGVLPTFGQRVRHRRARLAHQRLFTPWSEATSPPTPPLPLFNYSVLNMPLNGLLK